MNRFRETYLAPLSGIVLAALSLGLNSDQRTSIVSEMADTLLNVSAIMVAFLAATLTILLTSSEPTALRRLKTAPKAFSRLVAYHWTAIVVGMLTILLTIVLLLIHKCAPPVAVLSGDGAARLLFFLWAFAGGWSYLAFFVVIWLVKSLFALSHDAGHRAARRDEQ